MTHSRPNALSLAVAIAVCSSIIGTQALANRRLQTKFVGIQDNAQAELIRSEVIVKPTLDDDQQPIPKSFTTTYPDRTRFSAYFIPSFTDILSGIDADVSIVDLFETDENDVAQKYTKILKVGDEDVFRFTHNLEEEKLIIEVRAGMTDQDSVEAVLDQMDSTEPLEPLTKIARPAQLNEVLEGANERAGKLGTRDHYVALATIEIEQAEVDGRTFMRLISGGDQPPELKRLGQSLFVNDEALLAAATSAYFQVHVLRKDLQQQALNELLKHSKPIGYVVHVEDDTRAYSVPVGYPKLEVTEAPGEVIVFHGHMQYPNDIAFIENLHKFLEKAESNYPVDALKTQVNSYDTMIYQYVIRSRQMALLEESAAHYEQYKTEFKTYPLARLAYYEYLRQALTSATPDNAYQFEFTFAHIKAAWSVITPAWLQFQLEKHFGFKPVIRNLLTNQRFIRTLSSVVNIISETQVGPPGVDEEFSAKVISDMTRQLPEMYKSLEELQTKEAIILQIRNKLQHTTGAEVTSEEEKLKAQQISQRIGDELLKLRAEMEALENREQALQQESKRIPALAQQLRDARKVYNSERATMLSIDDWDDTLPPEEQATRTRERLNEILTAVAAPGLPEEDTVKTNLAVIEGQIGIIPDNENDLGARFRSVQTHLQQQSTRTDAAIKARYATIAAHLNPQGVDSNADIDAQEEQLIQKIKTMSAQEQLMRQQLYKMDDQREIENSYTRTRKRAVAAVLGIDLRENTLLEDRATLESTVYYKLYKLKELEEELEDIRTPDHPKARPEVLEKLAAVEKVLKIDDLNGEDDVYYRREAISKEIQTYLIKTRLRVEREALEILKTVEKILEINVNEGDDKATRLGRIRTKFDNNEVSESMLDTIGQTLWKEDITAASQKWAVKYEKLQRRLTFYVEDADGQVIRQNTELLKDIEEELQIYSIVRYKAKERGRAFLARLANDLGVKFENDAPLSDNKYVLYNQIWALMEEVEEVCGNEDVKRIRNNEIAHQLNIQDYKDDATIEDQNILINKRLQQLDEEVLKTGFADVNEHITAIENELDRQIARLGPKPRYVYDREVVTVRRAIEEAESELTGVQRKLNTLRDKQVAFLVSRADLQHTSDEEETPLKQGIKQLQNELGLAAGDEQTFKDRVDDIKHFLRTCSAEKRDEVLGKATKALNIQINGDLGLLEEADHFIANKAYSESHDQDETHEVRGKQRFATKEYIQVRKFLRVHDKKVMDVNDARAQEDHARTNLVRKEREMIDFRITVGPSEAVPRYEMAQLALALRRKSEAVSKAKQDLADHDALLEATEEAAGLKPDSTDTLEDRINALRYKRVQLVWDGGSVGKIRQLNQEQASLEGEIEIRKACIERMKDNLRIAEKVVENNDDPFQYTPRQTKVQAAMNAFTQQHPLKQQALEAAIGLTELAAESGNAEPFLTTPFFSTFDFKDEFAPILLQAMVGDNLTFDQAIRIVKVFKSLKTTFPPSPFEPTEDRPLNVLKKVQELVYRARNEMATGAQQYDGEIRGMGKRAIHFVEHESKDLTTFQKYFTAGSGNGNKIIALLRDGLISKVELQNYMKAIRGADGYQPVEEFEHFLGYRHGVNVIHFSAVVHMLSDKGAEEFMQSAFMFVPVTATGPAGMQESIVGMKEFSAAVIANYVLDDIAFENGRK
ncbi:hypothetical protein, partial [Endozoicomonas sp. SESOKO3]|uniref:hypothetical protein n=2 Tax=unclassified Endozoicomonas TaxID=2644528 RepID=UPI0021482A8F